MKLATKVLLASVQSAIKDAEAEADRKHAKVVATCEQGRAEWLASDNPDKLQQLLKRIQGKLRRGQVVTYDDFDDIERRYHDSEIKLYRGSPTGPERKPADVEHLVALRNFLRAVNDAEISTHALREAGFRNLADVVRRAVELPETD